jgi:hypothetical protein
VERYEGYWWPPHVCSRIVNSLHLSELLVAIILDNGYGGAQIIEDLDAAVQKFATKESRAPTLRTMQVILLAGFTHLISMRLCSFQSCQVSAACDESNNTLVYNRELLRNGEGDKSRSDFVTMEVVVH